MAIEKELLDNLFSNCNYKKPEDLIGENGLLKTARQGHLGTDSASENNGPSGHEKHDAIASKGGGFRNDKTGNPSREFANVPTEVCRDRDSSFDPKDYCGRRAAERELLTWKKSSSWHRSELV